MSAHGSELVVVFFHGHFDARPSELLARVAALLRWEEHAVGPPFLTRSKTPRGTAKVGARARSISPAGGTTE
jgi:hypothetical protein